MPKKATKNIIEPSETISESFQEATEQPQQSTSELMWRRSEAELERLSGKRKDLEAAIAEKQNLRNTLLFQDQKAGAEHREARDTFNTLNQELTLAKQRLLLGENTPAEDELQKAFTSLEKEHTTAQTNLDHALKTLQDAQQALVDSLYLLDECGQHQNELEDLTTQHQITEQIHDEQKALRGIELKESVIEQIHEALDHQRQVTEAAEAKVQAALAKIETELAEWPELASEISEQFSEKVEEEVEESPGKSEEAPCAPEEHKDEPYIPTNSMIRVLEAWLAFLHILRENGQKAKFYEVGKTWLIDALALPQGRLQHFMQQDNWLRVRKRDASTGWQETYYWTTIEMQNIENVIEQEREKERYGKWQALPSAREW